MTDSATTAAPPEPKPTAAPSRRQSWPDDTAAAARFCRGMARLCAVRGFPVLARAFDHLALSSAAAGEPAAVRPPKCDLSQWTIAERAHRRGGRP
jgi:hypothetical protein